MPFDMDSGPTDERPPGRCAVCGGHVDREGQDICERRRCQQTDAASFGYKECPVCGGDYQDCVANCDGGFVPLED